MKSEMKKRMLALILLIATLSTVLSGCKLTSMISQETSEATTEATLETDPAFANDDEVFKYYEKVLVDQLRSDSYSEATETVRNLFRDLIATDDWEESDGDLSASYYANEKSFDAYIWDNESVCISISFDNCSYTASMQMDGTVDSWSAYSYDEDGSCEYEYDANGELLSYYITLTGDAPYQEITTWYDENHEIMWTGIYQYNADYDLLWDESYDEDGKLVSRTVYSDDENSDPNPASNQDQKLVDTVTNAAKGETYYCWDDGVATQTTSYSASDLTWTRPWGQSDIIIYNGSSKNGNVVYSEKACTQCSKHYVYYLSCVRSEKDNTEHYEYLCKGCHDALTEKCVKCSDCGCYYDKNHALILDNSWLCAVCYAKKTANTTP